MKLKQSDEDSTGLVNFTHTGKKYLNGEGKLSME